MVPIIVPLGVIRSVVWRVLASRTVLVTAGIVSIVHLHDAKPNSPEAGLLRHKGVRVVVSLEGCLPEVSIARAAGAPLLPVDGTRCGVMGIVSVTRDPPSCVKSKLEPRYLDRSQDHVDGELELLDELPTPGTKPPRLLTHARIRADGLSLYHRLVFRTPN